MFTKVVLKITKAENNSDIQLQENVNWHIGRMSIIVKYNKLLMHELITMAYTYITQRRGVRSYAV
jgi:hypothetical protein